VDTDNHTHTASTMAAPKVLILCSKFEYIIWWRRFSVQQK